MMKTMHKLFIEIPIILLAIIVLVAGFFVNTNQNKKQVRIIPQSGPSTLYSSSENYGNFLSFDLDIINQFSSFTGYEVSISAARSPMQSKNALMLGFADIAILAVEEKIISLPLVATGPSFFDTHYQVTFNKKSRKPMSNSEFRRYRLGLSPSGWDFLKKIKSSYPEYKSSKFVIADNNKLFAMLDSNYVGHLITDYHASINLQRFYPSLSLDKKVSGIIKFRWITTKEKENLLGKDLVTFTNQLSRDGNLERLKEKYFGHLHRLKRQDIDAFLQRIDSILPKYKSIFEEAGKLYRTDWRLIAALGYQESHWNPKALSPTGVKGLMMLTKPTASRLGVTNRYDARQNIFAATKYLNTLNANLPKTVQEPDRTWMALAAYNVGAGHVTDARIIAARLGLNPNFWVSILKTLPLLTQKKYYSSVKHGYARGGEAVNLVQRVRNYHEILLSRKHN